MPIDMRKSGVYSWIIWSHEAPADTGLMFKKIEGRAFLAPTAGLFILTGILCAQIGGSGSVQGTVSDPSGAVIPGATVVATNVATGVKTTRQTTGAGLYVISPLAPGNYTLSVSAAGFQPVAQQNVIVDALSTVGLSLTLKVGSSSAVITVFDAPLQLHTEDATLGASVGNEVYSALPLA